MVLETGAIGEGFNVFGTTGPQTCTPSDNPQSPSDGEGSHDCDVDIMVTIVVGQVADQVMMR